MGTLIGLCLLIIGLNLYFVFEKNIASILVLICFIACFCLSFTMEQQIKERGAIATSQETIEYQLVSLHEDTAISGSGRRSYIEISEKTVYHFYYKTQKNGKDGFAPKTITSNEVFIDETYEESAPVILEIRTTYEYQFTKFEKWWVGELISLQPYTYVSYEIYVPTGSIVETYQLN